MADALQIDAVIQAVAGSAELPRETRTWDRLRGRVALITGAARGMGAAEARLFVAEGAQVVIADVLEAEAAALAQELGANAVAVRLDVTSREDWSAAVAHAQATFGPVSVLVNNAAISHVGPIVSLEIDDYRRVMAVNQDGALLGIQAVVPSMERFGRGSIINISSVDGIGAHPGLTPYVSSKFALRGLTRVACLELGGRGIRVNTVHPSVVDTPMLSAEDLGEEMIRRIESQIPLGFIAHPDDVARTVLFLASDESRYISGAEIVVDAGVMAKVPLSPS
ncbi:MAG: 3-alpha-hydroxysteroid dehydrogenase [Acidimicrobiia bacterium]